jgi:hypothetical protein
MVRHPASAQFLTGRGAVPDQRIALRNQVRAVEALQRENRALSAPELPNALVDGDLEEAWPALPFYARRRIVETLIASVTLLPTGRGCRQFDPSSVRIDWAF